jgi:hypothetical protein
MRRGGIDRDDGSMARGPSHAAVMERHAFGERTTPFKKFVKAKSLE